MTSTHEDAKRDIAQPLRDIAIVLLVSAAAFAGELAMADHLPWGDEARGVIAVLLGAVTAVWLTLGRSGSLADLGLRRPDNWLTVPLWSFGILVVFVIAQATIPLLVAQVVDMPQPDMSRYDAIRGNLGYAVAFGITLPLAAAIPEEIIYRGFMVNRLIDVFGHGRGGRILAVTVQALIFGLVHFQWGPGGVIVAAIMGAVWGFAFLLCGRNLWIVIIAHSAAHVALVTQLYFAPVPV